MAVIVDRRQTDKNKSSDNRRRFISRYKNSIKKSLNDALKEGSIKSVGGRKVTVPRGLISEPTFHSDRKTGTNRTVHPGNKHWNRGDKIFKPKDAGNGSGGAGNGGEGEDDFTFVLTKAEVIDLFFEDLELPNFVKKSANVATQKIRQKAGYTKDGVPSQIVIKKTFENAIARRIAAKANGNTKKPPFLDDIDLRYRNSILINKPERHATMYCVMDVSGSMGEADKLLAKKFFMLLYLFLTTCYRAVDVKFIRHTTSAELVDENTFFYSRESGGTAVSSALKLLDESIDRDCVSGTNVYVAQISDGDNWVADNDICIKLLNGGLLDKVQYMAYLNIVSEFRSRRHNDLLHIYEEGVKDPRLQSRYVEDSADVKHVLRDLFRKKGAI